MISLYVFLFMPEAKGGSSEDKLSEAELLRAYALCTHSWISTRWCWCIRPTQCLNLLPICL